MTLPVVSSPKYELLIEELNKKIKYRPFFVKEHKTLLQAIETEDESLLVNSIVDIVKACTFEKVDIDKLPVHLVDYIFLHIYIKSIGARTPAVFTCRAPIEKDGEVKSCDTSTNIMLPLDKAKISYPEGYQEKKNIQITNDIGIRLRVPTFEDFRAIKLDKSFIDITDQFIFSCIESVYSKDKVQVPGTDFSSEEMVAWIDGLDGSVMEKMSEFFKQLPYLGLTVPVTCHGCGKKEELHLEGLEDFFV